MGLCKCNKKRVTNQFCFEHRVNVCEHCMVTEHPQCIIQSYLRWLNDSDYSPVCQLCQKELISEECIRLVCYDVFHKNCLNDWATKLPPNTAPAGYRCPICSSAIFPASNLVSPVADELKEFFKSCEWARVGLEMPIVKNNSDFNSSKANENSNVTSLTATHGKLDLTRGIPDGIDNTLDATTPSTCEPYGTDSPFGGSSQHRNISSNITKSRKDSDSSSILMNDREDEEDFDKYKRRPLSEWFTRLKRTFLRPSSRHHQSLLRMKPPTSLFLTLFVVFIIIFLLAYLGHRPSDDDPQFDPFQNPNVRVQE